VIVEKTLVYTFDSIGTKFKLDKPIPNNTHSRVAPIDFPNLVFFSNQNEIPTTKNKINQIVLILSDIFLF
tara:strand:+ start:121 stop:330 length:210 start_codon:yes stop_codon:yes gene_type:complete